MPESFPIRIRQHPVPLAAEMGRTILETALAAGVPYPHGCRSGNCGACKSRLIAGEIDLLPHSEYALTPDERADGLVLACRSVPWSAVEIAWLDEGETVSHPIRIMTCRVAGAERMTHDIRQIRLEVLSGGPYVFSAGQYARVAFPGLPVRDYSMANTPDDPVLEFHVRHVPGGVSSSYAFESLSVGEEVRVEGPFGSSWLRENHEGPIFCLAGGSGLAPIKSIVEQAITIGFGGEIRLYHGVRGEEDIFLEDHFSALAATKAGLRYTPVLSEPRNPTSRRTGFVHDALRADIREYGDGYLQRARAYLAGPPPMVEAAAGWLETAGMPPDRIHADAFYTEAERTTPAAPA